MFTLENVLEVLDRIDTNRTNPEPGYVYTGPNGDHCIAGQVCVELGLDVPEWDDAMGNDSFPDGNSPNPNTKTFAITKMAEHFDSEAALFLSTCQEEADDDFTLWSDVVVGVRDEFGV